MQTVFYKFKIIVVISKSLNMCKSFFSAFLSIAFISRSMNCENWIVLHSALFLCMYT